MKKFRGYYLLILMLIVPIVQTIAQETININDVTIPKSRTQILAASKFSSSEFSEAERVRTFFSNRNLSSLNIRNRGDILMLDFFDDKRYQAVIQNINTTHDGITSIRANIIGKEDAYCYMVVSSKGVSMTAEIPELDEEYFIGNTNGNSYVSLYKRSAILNSEPGCGADDVPENRIAIKDLNLKSASPCTNMDLEAKITIDLMVVYTPEAKKWAENSPKTADINSLISTLMSISNQVMDNSKTGVTFRLVHKHEVKYTESDVALTDLQRLRGTNDGYMDEVHSLRKQYGADLVMLLGVVKGVGGIAYLPGSANGNSSSSCFSIVHPSYTVTGYTAVHEMGHNFGCGHHRDQNSKGVFSYSTGWRGINNSQKKVCSVMPYAGSGESRIPYFSTPDIIVDGVKIGTSNYEDNVLTIKRMKCVTSEYAEAVQKTPPTISISSPANGSTVNSSSVNVTANASDPNGSIKKVDFYLNGTLKNTDTTSPYSATISPLRIGSNTIMAKAFDNKDATDESSITVTYTVSGGENDCNGVATWVSSKAYNGGDKVYYDGYIYTAAYWTQNNRPDQNYAAFGKPWLDNRVPCTSEPTNVSPTISIISPSSGTTVYSNSVDVTTTANTPSGSISKVEFYLNGALKSTKTASPYVATLSVLNQGGNTIKAMVYDNKGQKAESVVTVNYSPQVSNIPPSITITSPANGSVISSPTTNVSVDTEDKDGSVQKVEYYLNGVLNQTSTTRPSFSGLSIGVLSAGANTIKAKVYDDKGATAESTISFNHQSSGGIDTQAPTKVENLHSTGSTTNSIDLKWNASTDNVGITIYRVFDADTNVRLIGIAALKCTVKDLKPNTTYRFFVQAIDAAGNLSEKSEIISVKTQSDIINTPPTVSITSPSNGTTISANSVSVSATAGAINTTVSKVEFFLNGVLKATKTAAPYTATVSTLNSGSNSIMAKVIDNKGATAESSVNVNYSAPVANIPPTVSITSPANGVTVNTSNINVSLNAADSDGTISKVELYLNGTLKSTVTTTLHSVSIGALKSGANTIMAKAYDNKGATGESNININYKSQEDDCMGIATWASSKVYNGGDKAKEGDIIYQANHWTQNNKPSTNNGNGKPWAVVSRCDGTIDVDAFGETQVCGGIKILVWKKETIYDKTGTKVVYGGKIYESKYWTQGNIPSNGGAWSLIGTCK